MFFTLFISVLLVASQKRHLERNIERIKPDWIPQNVFTCAGNRSQARKIQPPAEPNVPALTRLWDQLSLSFSSHATSPRHLVKPGGHTDADKAEDVREQVSMSDAQATASRESHDAIVREIPAYPSDLFHGKGVVMLAGGPYSEFAATSLGMLREVGSRLPAELWYIDDDEELEGWCDELRAEGIACRKLSDYIDVKSLKHPYQYKVMTMLFSSFEEMLFLDADSFPLLNPDDLFQTRQYLRTGAVMWPDYWMSTASSWTAYVVGLASERRHMFLDNKTAESGQILWNKKMHWRSLVLAAYYNYLGPDFYYTMISGNFAGWGDKDTFPWAMRALGESYYHVPHDIVTVFHVTTKDDEESQGIGMAQADPRNEEAWSPMFLHNNIVKWSMREFLCEDCDVIWVDSSSWTPNTPKKLKSLYTNEDSTIYGNLHENKRILRSDKLVDAGLDPEPMIWKALEHTACKSKAWGSPQLCDNARRHMKETFGFDFRPTRVASATGGGYGEAMCVIDPPKKPNTIPAEAPDAS